jgi:hypothetical protein
MNTDEALEKLRGGYCLWIGAGVDVHLGTDGKEPVPGWAEVVKKLELGAGLCDPPSGLPFADRIERCLGAMRRLDFQRKLRGLVVRPLAKALVDAANVRTEGLDVLPASVRQIAHLGTIANPIVNFNVETLSSQLVQRRRDPLQHSAV